jgi:N-methylhydantoinase B/oxoprolinase/acetone carboxylase alpha subunit
MSPEEMATGHDRDNHHEKESGGHGKFYGGDATLRAVDAMLAIH